MAQMGSGFTNIQRVLGANQNNQLGSTINQGVSNQANQFKTGLNQAQSEFNTDINKAKTDLDDSKSKAQGVLQSAQNLQGGQKLSDDQNTNWQNFTGSTYQGPQNLNNADRLASQAKNAQNQGQATQSQAGRQGLLQQYVGKGQYTSGQQNLDNLLLGQTGAKQLQQARQSTQGLGQQLDKAQNVAQGLAQNQANVQQSAIKDLTGQAVTGATGWSQGVQDQLTNLQKTQPELYNRVYNELMGQTGKGAGSKGLDLSQETFDTLGLGSGTNIYNTTGQQFAGTINQAQNLNLSGLTGADKYAQYEALRQLGGTDAGNDIYAGQDLDVLGQYQGVGADATKRQALLDQAKKNYDTGMNSAFQTANTSFGQTYDNGTHQLNLNEFNPIFNGDQGLANSFIGNNTDARAGSGISGQLIQNDLQNYANANNINASTIGAGGAQQILDHLKSGGNLTGAQQALFQNIQNAINNQEAAIGANRTVQVKK